MYTKRLLLTAIAAGSLLACNNSSDSSTEAKTDTRLQPLMLLRRHW